MFQMIFFLLLPIEVFAERNISCDTRYGDFLYQAKDSKIDVFVSYADSAMYSIEIKSETDSAWEVNKTTLAEDEMAEKMANLRAKKKPAKLSNISQDVLDLPEDII